MPHDHRPAGAHAARWTRRTAPSSRRAWRLRSRRAQVSAVAVILALLLIVTFIANYLTTTLPNTMGQNDVQHEVQVQNQVAQLAALLQETADSEAVGAQVSQPVALGSAAAPPFAGQDSSTIAPGNLSGGLTVNFTLAGPSSYSPPTGGTSGGIIQGSGCTHTSQSITCSGAATIIYNFTGALGSQSSYSLTLSGGGSAHVNVTSNQSSITVTASATTLIALDVLGSNDTVSVTVSNVPENILILGNYDTVTLTGSATSSFTHIVVVGIHDTVTTSALSGTNTIVASVYGSSDAVNPGTLSGTNKFGVYFNGFKPSSPSATCPVDNLASTDTVSQPTGGGTFAVTYNNTTGTTGTRTNGVWSVTYQIPTPFACPFATQVILPVPTGGAPRSASLVVQLRNTYAPSAEVALDQGAVVYAQPGAIPVFVVPPPISYASGVLSVFVPQFSGGLGTEAGSGTADVLLRLLSVQQFQIPSSGFYLENLTKVTVTVVSQYVAAWYAYFQSVPALAPYVTCSPTGANSPCTALYQPGQSLGTVTLAVPVSWAISFDLIVGLYSIGLA